MVEKAKDLDLRVEIFSLCMSNDCEMAYFSADYGYLYLLRDVSTPIDFKDESTIKYACYCHEITIDELRHAVLNEGINNAKAFLRNKPVIVERCQQSNPFGCHCMADINKMIDEIKLGKSGEI